MNAAALLNSGFRTACLAAVLAGSTGALAGNFSVSPVRIYMAPADRAVAVTLTNESDDPVALQADLYSWNQNADGSDDLALTEDLIVAPPIIKLGARARQVVRLARLTPPDPSRQLTYRLIVREVPEATAPKSDKGIVLQLPIALALSMPVFITPPAAARDVQCQVSRMDEQNLSAVCQNTGTAYAQIRTIVLARGAQELAKFEGGTYILPGSRRAMSIKADRAISAGPATARVLYDDGKATELPVQLP